MSPEPSFLRGVYNITPTPFHADGTLDEASLATLVEFNLARRVNGLTVLGVMGEAHKLSDLERDRVIAATVDESAGRLPICVGATHGGTDGCIGYSRRAAVLGANALMIAPPKLSRSSDAALRRHYLTVADAVDLPIVVQDYPPASGVFMTVEFVAALAAECPRCRWLKAEDDPTPPKIGAVLAANPDVQVFGGLGGVMLLEELRRGAVGTMTGFGFPEILVEICDAYFAGDHDRAATVFYKYCPLMRFENQAGINVPLRKEIYHRRGAMASPCVRSPSPALDAGTLADLEDLLTRLDLR